MSVTWNYNGTNQLQATLSASTSGKHYKLQCGDADSTEQTTVGTGSPITITVTDIGGIAGGDQFYAFVYSLDADDFYGINVFKYGSSSTTGVGFPVTFGWNGTNVTASFTSTVTHSYALQMNYLSSSVTDGSIGLDSGTSVTLTATPVDPIDASTSIIAYVFDQDATANTTAIAAVIFTAGAHGSGDPGSPATGGTDTGTASGSTSLYGTGGYGSGPYGTGGSAVVVTRRYPSLFVDKGYNRRARRDLYYPPTRRK